MSVNKRHSGALKVSTRISDRLLNQADNLRKRLAFDAVTARMIVHMDEIAFPAVQVSKPNCRRQRGPPNSDQSIAAFAGNSARPRSSAAIVGLNLYRTRNEDCRRRPPRVER